MSADFLQVLRSAASALLAQGALHGELFCLEWGETRSRLAKLLVMLVIGALFLLCSLLSLAALIVIISWGTRYQDVALFCVVGFFILGTVIAWWRVSALLKNGQQAFSGTLAEVSADLALIREKLGD